MKTEGEWTVVRGKGDELHEVRALGGKIALVFELSDAAEIAHDHNTHDQLIEACQAALNCMAPSKCVTIEQTDTAIEALRIALAAARAIR